VQSNGMPRGRYYCTSKSLITSRSGFNIEGWVGHHRMVSAEVSMPMCTSKVHLAHNFEDKNIFLRQRKTQQSCSRGFLRGPVAIQIVFLRRIAFIPSLFKQILSAAVDTGDAAVHTHVLAAVHTPVLAVRLQICHFKHMQQSARVLSHGSSRNTGSVKLSLHIFKERGRRIVVR
jgi:hypothetical protein